MGASQQPDRDVKRIDIDKMLFDTRRALDAVEGARAAVGPGHHYGTFEEHVERLAQDPEYRAMTERLISAANSWRGDAVEYLRQHPEVEHLPAPLRPPKSPPARFRTWCTWLTHAEKRVRRAQEAAQVLQALTGAPDPSAAIRLARDEEPLLDWADFEEVVRDALPADEGIYLPLAELEDQSSLEYLVRAIEESRARLARIRLEERFQPEGTDPIRDSLLRVLRSSLAWRTVTNLPLRGEAEIRHSLKALGFPPADTRDELARQARVAMSVHPDNLREYLAHVRKSADDLVEVTGAPTIAAAVAKARATIRANRGYVERPRTGPIVYSGGLPSLGKRR